MPFPRFEPITASTAKPPASSSPPSKPARLPNAPSQPSKPSEISASPAKLLELRAEDHKAAKKIASYFGHGRGLPILIEVDKPLYKPGEIIWLRCVQIQRQGEIPLAVESGLSVDFVEPRGSVQQTLEARLLRGHASASIVLPQEMVGGEYTIRVKNFVLGGETFEKKVTISVYQAPRLKKKLDFIRKAYGAGDTVQATLALHHATGAPLVRHPVSGVASLDGKEFKRFSTTTDDKGEAVLEVQLPAQLDTDDGLLTALISEGGVTESISRPLPLVVQRLKVGFFPEGGKALLGHPSRVYFAVRRAKDGKPFDIEGLIQTHDGKTVASVRSFHDGMGRFVYTPQASTRYRLSIIKPAGIAATFELPEAAPSGLSIHLQDDFLSTKRDLALLVFSDQAQTITATALQQETLIHQSRMQLQPGKNLLRLPLLFQRRGIVALTLWDAEGRPMAERLVFRHRDRGLRIEILPDKKRYEPRQTAYVKVRVTDADGQPLPKATLGLAVVDDTVLSYADDEEPNFLAQRYLSTQLTGSIHKPNFYFDRKKPKAYEALDLVMGTHGWRTFSWTAILAGTPPPSLRTLAQWRYAYRPPLRKYSRRRPLLLERSEPPSDGLRLPQLRPKRKKSPAKPRSKRVAKPDKPADLTMLPVTTKIPRMEQNKVLRELRDPEPLEEKESTQATDKKRPRQSRRAGFGKRDLRWGRRLHRGDEYERPFLALHPIRQFPTFFYPEKAKVAIRTDFRETIYWSPQITTDPWGEAKVSFGLNDSVTSFRIRASAVAAEGGLGSHDDTIASSRPFFVVAKLPLEVSAKDAIALPLTLRNDSDRPLEIRVTSRLSPEFKLLEDPLPRALQIAPKEARTVFYPIRVIQQQGQGTISFEAEGEGLSDHLEQRIAIFPRGFPRSISFSGMLSAPQPPLLTFHLPQDLQDAALTGEIQLYPNPLSSVLQGMEAMLQEPSGCFEQTSSTNYPNVMVMQYLKEHRLARPALLKRAGRLLDRGYQRLVGYETKTRGYEWFGSSPGHEALTAYGLMQFVEMKQIYPNVSQAMLQRTSDWLLSRRDGQGGFQEGRAYGAFGRAKKAITDAYITFALSETGRQDLNKELRWVEDAAYGSNDPYYLALVVNAILNVRGTQDKIGRSLLKKLLALQHQDGGFRGTEHSATMSSGQSLHIETTALSILAMLKVKASYLRALKAARWLQKQRSSYGGFGATQSTILALKALVAFERASRKPPASGAYRVFVGEKVVDSGSYSTDQTEPLLLRGFLSHLRPGKNTLRLELSSTTSTTTEIPYNLGLRYTTTEPLSDPRTAVSLQTSLDRTTATMGETVRLTATLVNQTNQGLPMILARLAFPGAFEAQLWQLKQMREQGLVDFYETRPREVIVYYRSMAPNAKKVLHFDLNARVTGNYVGAASSAYLYYTPERKVYTAPLVSSIRP